MLKGRGYLAYAQGKCIYYGKENYLGDKDDTLKAFVKKYNVETQVVLVRQTVPGSALFATEIVSLESRKESQVTMAVPKKRIQVPLSIACD